MRLRYISLSLLILLAGTVQAQIRYIPPAAHAFSFGVGYGETKLYGDFYGKPLEPAFWADINYNITPYLSAGVQGQVGTLTTGGRDVTRKNDGFYIDNAYSAANANLKLSAGAFLKNVPLNTFIVLISGIYGGIGVGVINNSITTSTRGGLDQSALILSPIKTSSLAANVPIDAGININMPRIFGYTGLAVNVDYQYNFCQSDQIDGYDPKIPFNKHNDTYTYLSAGLRFYFGPIR